MRVALAKGEDRQQNISRALHRLVNKINFPRFKTVLIKPNLTGIDRLYCNTSKDAVKVIIDFLNVHYHPEIIFVGEGSGGAYFSEVSTWKVFKDMGYEELKEVENVELMNIDELLHNVPFHVDTNEGRQKVHLARPNVDFIISLALPKTHDLAIITSGLKNMMGLVYPADRQKIHGYCDVDGKDLKRLFRDDAFYLQSVEKIHKNILALVHMIKPDMTVIDGFRGMEGDGPVEGDPLFHGFALASCDAVAADFVCAQLMGLDPRSIGYLNYLTEHYMEGWNPEISGEDPKTLIKKYKLHRKYHLQKQWRTS